MNIFEITKYGTISLQLRYHKVELTIDGGVCVMNTIDGLMVSLSKCGKVSSIDNPVMGKIFCTDTRVEIKANHPSGFRYAKMWKRGISFTSEQRPVTFLMDAGGIRTTVDWFLDLDDETSAKTFYSESRFGDRYMKCAVEMVNQCQFWISSYNNRIWKLGDVIINEFSDGRVKINKANRLFKISMNSIYHSASITTPYVHMTSSAYHHGHLFARKENSRMHFDGKIFVVRHEGQSGAIDDENNLKIY